MNDLKHNKWDIIIKLLGSVGFIVTFACSAHQFNIQNEKNFKIKFWEQQLETYIEISNLASTLSFSTDTIEAQKTFHRFSQLYHGEAVMFEDTLVRAGMQNFMSLYIDYLSEAGLQKSVQKSARVLGRTCRESLAQDWDLELKELDFNQY